MSSIWENGHADQSSLWGLIAGVIPTRTGCIASASRPGARTTPADRWPAHERLRAPALTRHDQELAAIDRVETVAVEMIARSERRRMTGVFCRPYSRSNPCAGGRREAGVSGVFPVLD